MGAAGFNPNFARLTGRPIPYTLLSSLVQHISSGDYPGASGDGVVTLFALQERGLKDDSSSRFDIRCVSKQKVMGKLEPGLELHNWKFTSI